MGQCQRMFHIFVCVTVGTEMYMCIFLEHVAAGNLWGRYLRSVWIDPLIIRIFRESLLYGIYRAIDIGFSHSSNLDRHIIELVLCLSDTSLPDLRIQGGQK